MTLSIEFAHARAMIGATPRRAGSDRRSATADASNRRRPKSERLVTLSLATNPAPGSSRRNTRRTLGADAVPPETGYSLPNRLFRDGRVAQCRRLDCRPRWSLQQD